MSSLANGNFLCGAVEGFYGRPWTTEQRIRLFQTMKKMGLKHYMYAPKDDCKHRSYWRDMYSVEEAEHLTFLIESAKDNDVQFIYALSPGLDITFSSAKEVTSLKRKLEQVKEFGCDAFAILFDDIDTDMCAADKEIFQSFAHAQVSVTNEVYQHLGQPLFLFCPTEYCATRADPDVTSSEYLGTIGNKLLPGINILWTGPKVVSKTISVDSITELNKVLKRPPVIWDNIHANDYDIKRLFLGPYCGRSTDLISHLNGVLTNPNCEYEANFIALHTLSTWCHSSNNTDGKKDVVNDACNPAINADIKLETEGESETSNSQSQHLGNYNPRTALKKAISDWLDEFKHPRSASGKDMSRTFSMAPTPDAQGPLTGVTTCMSVTSTTDTVNPNAPVQNLLLSEAQNALRTLEVNKLAANNRESCLDEKVEPMDIGNGEESSQSTDIRIPTKTSSSISSNTSTTTANKVTDVPMQLNSSAVSKDNNAVPMIDGDMSSNEPEPGHTRHSQRPELPTYEDVELLVDLFYLPYQHGTKAVQMLEELHWLKVHAYHVTEAKSSKEPTPEAVEWADRACKFSDACKAVIGIYRRLVNIPNRSLLYDLYPYVCDIRGVASLIDSFVKWLGCSTKYKELFMSGDHEPWVFRGGLTAELQRMLPIDGATDLFSQRPPESVTSKVYTIRPYLRTDEASVYKICRLTCDDGSDGTDHFSDYPDLIGDKLIGGLVTLSPEYCFVLEDESGVCGYLLATLDAKSYYKMYEMAWIPEMRSKYPKPSSMENHTPAEEIILSFHEYKTYLPENVYKHHRSLLKIDVLQTVEDKSVVKNMLACALAALKSNGSQGAFVEVGIGNKQMLEFYSKLGFFEIPNMDHASDDVMILGRAM
ncbi:protein O-GlcNAcase-like isoform X2 [Ptychodera flava]|uniref:protein O-GlcNAcase-like isoform X2 n=1 Tax=Ptychodera flava TaxID=63121 RepID=UPI00396A83EF